MPEIAIDRCRRPTTYILSYEVSTVRVKAGQDGNKGVVCIDVSAAR